KKQLEKSCVSCSGGERGKFDDRAAIHYAHHCLRCGTKKNEPRVMRSCSTTTTCSSQPRSLLPTWGGEKTNKLASHCPEDSFARGRVK
uniref:Uncharacterized protein n=1 Tax=Anopheles arabiensis TaxID=7173 RepID=A0A182IH14_ANOAR